MQKDRTMISEIYVYYSKHKIWNESKTIFIKIGAKLIFSSKDL